MALDQQTSAAATPAATDPMPLNGIDHVELWVGNAKQAAFFYERAFGFRLTAYAGLETGVRGRTSYVLEQGRIRLVITGTLHPDPPIAAHHHKHGDGVKVIGLSVPDVDHAYKHATELGAKGVTEPHDAGGVRVASIETYGETLHTFIDRSGHDGAFLPGYEPVEGTKPEEERLLAIDHIVGN